MQAQHFNRESEARASQENVERFITSLTFEEINLRMNEVSDVHPTTFEWVFDEEKVGPWDNFPAWLKRDEHVYWINGKAGSGKSTLMKYMATNPKTRDFLKTWSPDANVLIVAYYFWLSGTKLQRSLKGFLCSALRQLILADKPLLLSLLDSDYQLITKRSLGDWSVSELQILLRYAVGQTSYSTCLFLDGLDEFDSDDDVESLLSLIGNLTTHPKIKVCISSRPEHYLVKKLSQYPHLRLQDLTEDDMGVCIEDELKILSRRCHMDSFDEWQVSSIVRIMTKKADGVFLWVRFVLRSITRGMQKDDGFEDLLDRIEELPSGMQQLYTQMWKRLNGDEARYHEEAAEYFLFAVLISRFRWNSELSLFELWVALDVQVQEDYLGSLSPQDPLYVIQRCEMLKGRITTRCAGLLEIKTYEETNLRYLRLRSSFENENNERDHMPTNNAGQDDPNGEERKESIAESTVIQSRLGDREKRLQELQLGDCYRMKVSFIHRTARDFLNETSLGQALLGNPASNHSSRLKSIHIARMATLIQGLKTFDPDAVKTIMFNIAYHKLENETELLIMLERVCTALSDGQTPQQDISRKEFWTDGSFMGGVSDFASLAAYYGYFDYARRLVEAEKSQPSSEYLGYLFLSTVMGLRYIVYCPYIFGYPRKHLSMLSYYAVQGANLFSSHEVEPRFAPSHSVPAIAFLLSIVKYDFFGDYQQAKEMTRTFQRLLPFLCCSTTEFPVALWLYDKPHWSCSFNRDFYLGEIDLDITIYMTTTRLCYYVMTYIEEVSAYKPHWM